MSFIFISHSGKDRPETEKIAHWLKNEGHEGYFLDFDPNLGLSAGKRWEEEIYQKLGLSNALLAVVTPNWLQSKWCFAEVTLARYEGKQVLLVKVAPSETSGLFPDLQHVDATTNEADAFRLLARSLKEAGIDAEERFVWDRSRPIYPGLTAFREEDAAIFFGRDSEVRAGIERLDAMRQVGRPNVLLCLGRCAPTGSQDSRDFYTRADHASSPMRASGMLAV